MSAQDTPDMTESTASLAGLALGASSQPVTRPPSPDPSKKTPSLTIVIKLGTCTWAHWDPLEPTRAHLNYTDSADC